MFECRSAGLKPYNISMRVSPLLALGAALCALFSIAAQAGVAAFDLAGPDMQVTVSRGHETLPIAEVPNLAVGERLWIRADLPSSESEHYLLIVAFLRGATNPPPHSWFHDCATWKGACARKGMRLRVPPGAGQVLVFLAPQTGGDFRTLVGAVRGRPGAFVRTSQDLNQATLDISRLDRYLGAIQSLDETAPQELGEAAPKLARSLAIKVKARCLQRIAQLQAPCLMQGGQSLILNDGHSTSIVEALTSGPATDLAMEASYTPKLSYGYYSPYIASVLDIARIFASFTTADYQYIPALAVQHGTVMSLTLNTPPSFHEPQSVLVTALPAVEATQFPPLHAVDPQKSYCVRRSPLVLPVEGAPLVFSTDYAHGMTLRLTGRNGRTIDLPARADAQRGGFVVDTRGIGTARLGNSVQGELRGRWGFEAYDGPVFQLQNARADGWSLARAADDAAIVGREDTIQLMGHDVSCLDGITVRDAAGNVLAAPWKPVGPNEAQVRLPLQQAQPGPLTLILKQFGPGAPQTLPLEAYSQAASLDGFTLHAGDSQGVLTGGRLDEVAALTIDGVAFTPTALSTRQGLDQLALTAEDAQAASQLKQGEVGLARVTLKDGRVLKLDTVVAAPRPSVSLIAKSVYPSLSSRRSHIQLSNGNELPQDARLTFSVRAQWPAAFDPKESIEVATADGSYSTTLSLTNGGIMLETEQVAIVTLNPSRAFGPSAFGPLRFRVIDRGVTGGWQPLATLVRLPRLHKLVCPATPELACRLSGADLFLIDSIGTDPALRHAVQVPDGFPGYALPVPHPKDGELYVKLRDDPSVINIASIAEHLLPGSRQKVRASDHHAAATKPTHARGRQAAHRVADTPTGGKAASAAAQTPKNLPAPGRADGAPATVSSDASHVRPSSNPVRSQSPGTGKPAPSPSAATPSPPSG